MFLPTTKTELDKLGWKQLDIILITGDAYIDHPAFGTAVIGKYLYSKGYKVGVISQPNWKDANSFKVLGKPRLFFGITAGNMDSMVNHFTARKKTRAEDAYTAGGKMGLRPNRASLVYTNEVKKMYKNTPIILGGIEASLRRIPHYDYWSNKVRNSLLFDSKADILVYGMGEVTVAIIAKTLKSGRIPKDIPGTVVTEKYVSTSNSFILPEFHKKFTKKEFWLLYKQFYKNYRDKTLYIPFAGRVLRHNIPSNFLTTNQMDEVFHLPFEREIHPSYLPNNIKAFQQIKNSITSHRGCFGGCNFCAIGLHQGKTIRSRSQDSIKNEIETLVEKKYFKGTITDVGGPTANMYGMYCKLDISDKCKRNSCLYPKICKYLEYSHTKYKALLWEVSQSQNVKNVFIGSGIRFDLALKDREFIKQVAENHTSGLLKLAPEHISEEVLEKMNKPSFSYYRNFVELFIDFSKKVGKKQFTVPYIIVGHPGEELKHTIEMAFFLKKNNIKLKQVQQFTPTPMTISTLMYFTGYDLEKREVYVPRDREVRLMKALVQWYKKSNKKLIIEALKKANRQDLLGFFLD